MTEFLYAASHIEGDFANPDSAVGNTPGTWAGTVNTNTTETSRWALENPSGNLDGTQTVRVVARKGSNSGNPSLEVALYEAGVLVQALADVVITSTTGQTVTGTFDASAITNPNNLEIEVVSRHTGGNAQTRNSAQISHIEHEATIAASVPTVLHIASARLIVPEPAEDEPQNRTVQFHSAQATLQGSREQSQARGTEFYGAQATLNMSQALAAVIMRTVQFHSAQATLQGSREQSLVRGTEFHGAEGHFQGSREQSQIRGTEVHGAQATLHMSQALTEVFDPDNFQVVVDGTNVQKSWDPSPMVPI